MVPQDDLAVFSSSGQESATPHLTHAENAALVSFDLPSDLERCPDTDLFVWTTWYHHITSHEFGSSQPGTGPRPLTSGSFSSCCLVGVPGPDQQDSTRVSSQNVSWAQEGQTLDELWLFIFLKKKGKETGLRLGLDQALDQFNLDSKGEADLTQDYRHETGLHRNTRKYRLFVLTPKMPCLRASDVPVQVQKKMWDFPQVTMVFGSVGWNSTSRTTSFVVYKSNKKWLRTLKKMINHLNIFANEKKALYLDFCYFGLLLPIPHGQHVIVTVVDHTEVLTRVLEGEVRSPQTVTLSRMVSYRKFHGK